MRLELDTWNRRAPRAGLCRTVQGGMSQADGSDGENPSAAESALLPGELHGDPADRFLIAPARTGGLTLATRDQAIIDYGNAGHVRVLEL
jgi:hypothetical protein